MALRRIIRWFFPSRRSGLPVVAALLLAACSAGEGARSTAASSPPSALQAETFFVGGSPWGVVADGEGAWVSDAAGGRVVRLSADGRVLEERPVPGPDPRAAGLVLAGDDLWVAQLNGALAVLPSEGGPARTAADVGEGEPADVAVGPSAAWLPGHGPSGALVQVDVASLSTTRRVELPESPFQAELDGNELWVAGLDSRLFRLAADSGALLASIDVGHAPRGLALTPDAAWVSLRDGGELVRLDRTDPAEVQRIPVGGQPWPVAAESREVWVALLEGAVVRVDATSMRVTHRVAVPPGARGLALTPTAVWVTGADGTATRIGRPAPASPEQD